MGACAGKSAAPKDPDKQPYEASPGGKKVKKNKKGRLLESDQTTGQENGAKLDESGDKDIATEGDRDGDDSDIGTNDLKDDEIEERDAKATALVAPVVEHLPPTKPTTSDAKEKTTPTKTTSPKDKTESPEPKTPVKQNEPAEPAKPEDVDVKVPGGLTTEPPTVKTFPTAWKPQPIQSSKSTFSPYKPPPSRTSFGSKPSSPEDKSGFKIETKKEEKQESNMTVTVQSKTITKESRDTSLDKMKLPSLGEPVSAESIIQNIREKTKDTGIVVKSESKTTTVIKKTGSDGKEIVDVKTTETKYDGTPTDGKDRDVFVKTTSRRFTGDLSGNVTSSLTTSTEESPSKKAESSDTKQPAKEKVEKEPAKPKEEVKQTSFKQETKVTPVKQVSSPEIKDTTPVLNGSPIKAEITATTASPPKPVKVEELVIKEVGEVESKKPAPVTSPSKEPEPVKSQSSSSLPSPSKTSNLPSPTSKTSVVNGIMEKVEPVTPPAKTTPTKLVLTPPTENVLKTPTKEEPPINKPIPSPEDKPIPSPITVDPVVDDTISEDDEVNEKRKAIMKILCDSSTGQDDIIASHEWCPNTRSRLMQCIDKWANGEDKEKDNFKRVWAVTGKAGSGKTALAAEVYRKHSQHIAGAHFFHFCSPNLDNNDARYVLRSFAFQMCDSLPMYSTLLPEVEQLQELVDSSDLANMFQVLIQEPLLSAKLQHDSDQTVLVILDGVDECNAQTRKQLLHIINNFAENTPDWLYLLATTRDDNQILSQLENIRTVELKNSNDNMTDIKRYLKEPMGLHMDRITLDGGLTQLVKKTEGNFLCAKYLAEILKDMDVDKKIALREVEGMFPKGLGNIYKHVLKSFKGKLSEAVASSEVDEVYNKILGILCCALEPISTEFVDVFFKLDTSLLDSLNTITKRSNGHISFAHRNVAEWLHNQQEAAQYYIAVGDCRQRMSEYCWKWLEHIRLSSAKSPLSSELQTYALKRAIWHFLDIQKQQENVAGLLCELKYIEEKFKVSVVAVRHVLSDYRHAHQYSTEAQKLITMSDYMKKHPKLLQQMMPYHNFVKSEGFKLQQSPDFTIHIAANYPNSKRIQQNARLELEGKHWIEELTALPETHNINKPFSGKIEGVDLSPDGKTMALISKDEDNNLALCLVNVATCEKRMEPVDIKMLKDRIGLCVKFLMDGSAIFVGSITTFLNAKQGRPVPSGIDASSVQMKEKYSIECCDITRKHMVCGLSTFPWGGRSLHLSVFDLKNKKSIKTVEVLKFRFGGSSQFGVKCCAISEDDTMVGACVKQSNKDQLVCSIWCMSKWNVLHTVNVDGDTFTRCLFVNNAALLVGTSVTSGSDREEQVDPVQSKVWNFKNGNTLSSWNDKELFSVFNSSKQGYLAVRWFIPNGRALVQHWNGKSITEAPHMSYTIQGLAGAMDVVSSSDHIMVITRDEMKSYNISDLQVYDPSQGTGIMDILVKGISFYPRSDEAVIAHSFPKETDTSVGVLSSKPDDLVLSSTPLQKASAGEMAGKLSYFNGSATQNDVCQTNADGSFTVLNGNTQIQVWNRSSNAADVLPHFDKLGLTSQGSTEGKATVCVVSQKDNLLGVLFAECPTSIVTFDLKSRQMVKTFELSNARSGVSDFTFIPSNGHLMAYYKGHNHTLVTWNQKNGNVVSQKEDINLCYARLSPTSDRLVLSLSNDSQGGKLLLRNSDGNFGAELSLPGVWDPSQSASDAEFSSDGTIVTGVCAGSQVCRVWNAGNGEVLKDLAPNLTSFTEVVGMVTNTHVIFRDACLRVVDVASGVTVAVLPLHGDIPQRTSSLGIRVSPKGNFLVGANESGQLRVFQCHNFSAVKRKTTLQRMKSFVK